MQDLSMWFDIIVLGVILILGIKGLLTGLIREAFGFIGLIGGLALASRFSGWASEIIRTNVGFITNESLRELIAFVGVWLVFWLFCLLIGKFMARLVGASGLGFLDRFGGFIAGGAKFFLILAAVVAFLAKMGMSANYEDKLEDSKVYPLLMGAGKWLANIDVNALKNEVQSVIVGEQNSSKDADVAITSDIEETIKDRVEEIKTIHQDINQTQNLDNNISKGE